MEENKLPLGVKIAGVILLLIGVYALYFATLAPLGGESNLLENILIYLVPILIIALASLILLGKNFARIAGMIFLVCLGIYLIYLSWDFIRTRDLFFNDEIFNLVLGLGCLFLAIYLAFNKKVKEAFKK